MTAKPIDSTPRHYMAATLQKLVQRLLHRKSRRQSVGRRTTSSHGLPNKLLNIDH